MATFLCYVYGLIEEYRVLKLSSFLFLHFSWRPIDFVSISISCFKLCDFWGRNALCYLVCFIVSLLIFWVLEFIQFALHNRFIGDTREEVFGGTWHREWSVLGSLWLQQMCPYWRHHLCFCKCFSHSSISSGFWISRFLFWMLLKV